MSDVKLTRDDVEMAVDAVGDCTDWGHAGALRGLMPTFVAAARALLAVTEPASDEEVRRVAETLHDKRTTGLDPSYRAGVEVGQRAAEARVRRLAGFGEEGK
jgi:hypothetical protein